MSGHMANGGGRLGSRRRLVGWGAAAMLLLLPLLAMQFTDEVAWDLADFVFAGALLGGVGGAYELAARRTGDRDYRAAVGAALLGAFLLVWANAAVGIIGSEDNPANAVFLGVLAVGLAGAAAARFRPGGMARALVATAFAQALAPTVVLISGWGVAGPVPVGDVVMVTGFFVALWLASAWLFSRSLGGRATEGAE